MIKKLLLFFLLFAVLFSRDILSPEEAFKVTKMVTEDKISFKIVLGKDIYLYQDKIKVLIQKPSPKDLTQEIKLPQPIPHHDTLVYFNELTIDISKEMLTGAFYSKDFEVKLKYQGCSNLGVCYQPMSETAKISFGGAGKVLDGSFNETDTIANTLKEGSVLTILAVFFGFGLLLSMTPCIFPMIPILSSIIVSKGSENMSAKRGLFLSLIYVLAMSAAYTIAGVLAGLFGANLQSSMQNPFVLSGFALIFVALAFSMFGFYKLELPQSLQNKINKTTMGKEKEGILGVAIMGFLSALIVGPCVAPPLAGALVYIGQTGDAVLGGSALFVMSLGMGAPLLAIGAGAGKFMPKPGGWMDTISKAFGVVMLGVAIWMIERIIPVFYTFLLYSLLLMGTSVYLLLQKRKLAVIVAVVLFVLGYILALGAGSGSTNIFNPLENLGKEKTKEAGLNFTRVKTVQDLEKAINGSDKPVMIDFYADWCISCKELEHTTFKDRRVIDALKNFTLLQIDTTENSIDDKRLLRRYNLFGPPAIIFYVGRGEVESKRIVGYKTPEEFLNHIKDLNP